MYEDRKVQTTRLMLAERSGDRQGEVSWVGRRGGITREAAKGERLRSGREEGEQAFRKRINIVREGRRHHLG